MKPFLALAAAIALSGCADKILSDSSIRDQTALALNQPASAVTITDRRYDGTTNTYYTAHTPRGSYSCLINGGSIMAFAMTNPPDCTPSNFGTPPPSSSRLLRGRRAS